MKKNNPMSFNR